jgi:hypothetical protein
VCVCVSERESVRVFMIERERIVAHTFSANHFKITLLSLSLLSGDSSESNFAIVRKGRIIME